MAKQKITYELPKSRAGYLESDPLHHSQKLLKDDPQGMTFQLDIKPTFDLEMEMLSHGDWVEVLEPQWFRKRIGERATAAAKRY